MNKLTVLAILSLAFSAQVDANKYKGVERLVEYKCFIELHGGSNVVQHIRFKGERKQAAILKQMARELKVPNKKEKQSVYKIHECVLADQDFTEARFRYVDNNQVK
jgi:hypothetical protein